MKKFISLNNILDSYYSEDFDAFTVEDAYIFCKMRRFVASTARGNRRQRIMNAHVNEIEQCSILDRLVWDGEVKYIVGQDGIREMGILRDIFDRRR